MLVHQSKVPASFSKVKTPRLFPEYFHISRKKTHTKIHKSLSALLRFIKLGINTYSFRVGEITGKKKGLRGETATQL